MYVTITYVVWTMRSFICPSRKSLLCVHGLLHVYVRISGRNGKSLYMNALVPGGTKNWLRSAKYAVCWILLRGVVARWATRY